MFPSPSGTIYSSICGCDFEEWKPEFVSVPFGDYLFLNVKKGKKVKKVISFRPLRGLSIPQSVCAELRRFL